MISENDDQNGDDYGVNFVNNTEYNGDRVDVNTAIDDTIVKCDGGDGEAIVMTQMKRMVVVVRIRYTTLRNRAIVGMVGL